MLSLISRNNKLKAKRSNIGVKRWQAGTEVLVVNTKDWHGDELASPSPPLPYTFYPISIDIPILIVILKKMIAANN